MNEKQKYCECGNKLKRIYSRDTIGFEALNLYYCDKCGSVYEEQRVKKKKKRLSLKNKKLK